MQAQNVAPCGGRLPPADVDMPQPRGMDKFTCYSGSLWAILNVDQSQVVYPSERGSAQRTALEKNRSRGCRALRSPFLRCAWLRSLQHVQSLPKKLFTWTNQASPPSLSIPANTSKHHGRALWAKARPALFLPETAPTLSDDRVSAGYHRHGHHHFASALRAAYEGHLRNVKIWRPSCGQHLSLPFCLSPWLQPAQNLRQSLCPSKSHLQLNLNRPANTNNCTRLAASLNQTDTRLRLKITGNAAVCVLPARPGNMQTALTGRTGSCRPALFAVRDTEKVWLC